MPMVGFWIVVGAMALSEAAIIVAALRMRVRPVEARGVWGSRPAEVAWTLAPAGLLALLVTMSLRGV